MKYYIIYHHIIVITWDTTMCSQPTTTLDPTVFPPFRPWLALSRSQRFLCVSVIIDLGEAIAVVIVQTVENR